MKSNVFFAVMGLVVCLVIAGCRDKSTYESNIQSDNSLKRSSKPIQNDNTTENSEDAKEDNKAAKTIQEGTYVNISNIDVIANCSMVIIDYAKPTPLCIEKDDIIINVRYVRRKDDVALFLDSVVKDLSDKEVPFEKFDKTIPIATLAVNSNKTLTLDWKGFYHNGDIATDYALLGKKHLEGTFKQQH